MAKGRNVNIVDSRRCRALNSVPLGPASKRCGGVVLYWMSRDQRAHDNWALLKAQELALEREAALLVCFCLVPRFLDATIRHYDFMLRGLDETRAELAKFKVPFELRFGLAKHEIPALVKELGTVHAVVCDFSPLRVPAEWAKDVAKVLETRRVPVVQVDAHNVVPVWLASDKMEVGARTLRPKINRLLPEFLTEIFALRSHPHSLKKHKLKPFDVEEALASVKVDRSVVPCVDMTPGSAAGLCRLTEFVAKGLSSFDLFRNNPNKDACSNLSPWIHFGQISAQRCALVARAKSVKQSAGFIEELVIRRELADNFCFYNRHYDSLTGASQWAQASLKKHAKDKRLYTYSKSQLEAGKTHDQLWNAAQLQMVNEGKMHGFLRMYWAKKILEWSKTPAKALACAIYLNDRYSIDGRDPNGYVGCMWSVCGVHDMGWTERPIFGKVRYMNYEGCKRKFDVPQFEGKYSTSSGSLPHLLSKRKSAEGTKSSSKRRKVH